MREAQACQSVEKAGCPLPRPWQATEVAEEAHGSWCLQNGPVLTEQERKTESARGREHGVDGGNGAGTLDSGLVLGTVVGKGADDSWPGLRDTSAIHSTNTHPEPAPRQAQC